MTYVHNHDEKRDLTQCKNLYFFVSLVRDRVWLLFNGLLALCFRSFTSSVSLIGFYAENEPRNGTSMTFVLGLK